MSTLSQTLTVLNECIDSNTNALTVFEHSTEKVKFITDLLKLGKSKKAIFMHHPDEGVVIELASVTNEMLISDEDIYPKITPLLGLDPCNYRINSYLAIKSIIEYEGFILLSYSANPELTEIEISQLNDVSAQKQSALTIKEIRKEFKRRIAYKKECLPVEVKGKHFRKYVSSLSSKVLITDSLKAPLGVESLLSTKRVVALYHTNEFIELLFVDASHAKDVFCLTQFS